MENFNRKEHWEKIYQTKELKEVSWYQPVPETSLEILKGLELSESAKIIDVGGGDSFLVDHLLEMNFQDLTVLDISARAIERAKERLGANGDKVKWIVADVVTLDHDEEFDVWHDRAAFHFLTDKVEISKYIKTASKNLKPGGILIIGTFSDSGPDKCSGIRVQKYSEASMTAVLEKFFEKICCFQIDHTTPFDTNQNFTFCIFRNLK